MFDRRLLRPLLAAFGAALLGSRAGGFVMIDTAGPREIISPMSFSPDEAGENGQVFHRRSLKLSTKDKSLTAFVLGQEWRKSPETPPPGEFPSYEAYTLGATLKFKADNGVEDFFKFERWPTTELGGLFNWTSMPGGQGAPKPITSLTLQAGATSTDLAYIPATANPALKKTTKRNVSGFGALTGGVYWRNVPLVEQFALVLSAEVRRESNYEKLPKITTADLTSLGPNASGSATRVVLEKSAVVRWGDLQQATTVPVTAAAVFTHRADWIGHVFEDGKAETRFYWSPYFRVKTASGAGTSHAAGLNLAVRIKTHPKEGGPKLSYPLGLFIERGTDFGQSEWKTTVGASTVFTWGP
jgi:hypothetical protein